MQISCQHIGTLDLAYVSVVFEDGWTVHQEEALLKLVESFDTTAIYPNLFIFEFIPF